MPVLVYMCVAVFFLMVYITNVLISFNFGGQAENESKTEVT